MKKIFRWFIYFSTFVNIMGNIRLFSVGLFNASYIIRTLILIAVSFYIFKYTRKETDENLRKN